jgi:hypothetical protein
MRAVSGLFKLSVSTISNGLKYPISFGFIRIVLPIPLKIVRGVLKPFLVAQLLLGPVILIGFHLVSLPSRLSGTLAAWLRTVVLAPIARNNKLAAVDTGDLLHIVAPINGMNENNNMDALFSFGIK